MEHQHQYQGNKPIPKHPKPEDDVQLHIETVIPETEKEKEVPADQESQQKPEDPDAGDAASSR